MGLSRLNHKSSPTSRVNSHPHVAPPLPPPQFLSPHTIRPCDGIRRTGGVGVGRASRIVIRGIRRQDRKLQGRIALSVRASFRTRRQVAGGHGERPGRDVLAVDGSLEDRERCKGLVERDFVSFNPGALACPAG